MSTYYHQFPDGDAHCKNCGLRIFLYGRRWTHRSSIELSFVYYYGCRAALTHHNYAEWRRNPIELRGKEARPMRTADQVPVYQLPNLAEALALTVVDQH